MDARLKIVKILSFGNDANFRGVSTPNNPAGSKGRWFGRKGVRRTLRCAPPRFSLRGGGSAAPDNGGPGFAQNSGGGALANLAG